MKVQEVFEYKSMQVKVSSKKIKSENLQKMREIINHGRGHLVQKMRNRPSRSFPSLSPLYEGGEIMINR